MIAIHRHQPARGGFTLLEIVLVITLITLLFAVGVPLASGFLDRAEVDAAAEEATGLVRMARLQAMHRGQPTRVRYDEDEHALFIEGLPTEREEEDAAVNFETLSEDGYDELTMIGTHRIDLPASIAVQDVQVAVRLHPQLEQELEKLDDPDFTEGIVASVELTASSDGLVPEVRDDRLPPLWFQPDGSPLDQHSLRLVLVVLEDDEEPRDLLDDNLLDPDRRQIWIEVDGFTGDVQVHEPIGDIIRLANDG